MLNNIRFLPLDVPPFPFGKSVLEEFTPDTDRFYWWSEEYISVRNRDETWNKSVKLHNKHLKLVDFANQYLPFSGYILFKLVHANRDVAPHVDDSYLDYKGPNKDFNLVSPEFRQHQMETEPCGYRIIIAGDRKSLYLTDPEREIKKYCNIPETTDTFLLKSYGNWHGVEMNKNNENRLIVFIIGWLNKEQHFKLIKKSMEKYQSYLIGDR